MPEAVPPDKEEEDEEGLSAVGLEIPKWQPQGYGRGGTGQKAQSPEEKCPEDICSYFSFILILQSDTCFPLQQHSSEVPDHWASGSTSYPQAEP